jgi:1,4-dihydroxy-2-naphthoyl-CoA hydrolase
MSKVPPWDRATLPSPLIPIDRTFEGFLGLEWLDLTPTSAHVRLEVREDFKQPLGPMRAGIYCGVAETVASIATVNVVWKDGLIGAGLGNYASFLRPITAGTIDVTAILRGQDDCEWTGSRPAVRRRGAASRPDEESSWCASVPRRRRTGCPYALFSASRDSVRPEGTRPRQFRTSARPGHGGEGARGWRVSARF